MVVDGIDATIDDVTSEMETWIATDDLEHCGRNGEGGHRRRATLAVAGDGGGRALVHQETVWRMHRDAARLAERRLVDPDHGRTRDAPDAPALVEPRHPRLDRRPRDQRDPVRRERRPRREDVPRPAPDRRPGERLEPLTSDAEIASARLLLVSGRRGRRGATMSDAEELTVDEPWRSPT